MPCPRDLRYRSATDLGKPFDPQAEGHLFWMSVVSSAWVLLCHVGFGRWGTGKNHRATGEGAAEFRGTATKSLQNFGAPRSRLEIPEWFGRPYLRPYSVVAL